MDYYDKMLLVLCMISAIGLFVVAHMEKHVKTRWIRIAYMIPGLVVWILGGITGFEKDMAPAYIGGVLCVAGFLLEKERFRKALCVCLGCCVVAALIFCKVDAGYRCPDFVAEFEEGFEQLKNRYCLTAHKGIDFDDLYARYYPRFVEANKEHSKEKNFIAWHEMLCEFHDGHTYYMTDEDIVKEAANTMFGSDFGFSMVTLSDGRNVAVNVESGSAAEQAGITLGTEILSLNGKSVEKCKNDVKYYERVNPDLDNERFYSTIYAAGQNGNQLEVTFIDETGKEQSVSLKRLGFYQERLKETLEIVNGGYDSGTLTFTEIDDKTVLYRIKEMVYDTESAHSGDYGGLESELRQGLMEYKNKGYTRLILDVRGNNGGSPFMIITIAKLLAEQGEHFYVNSGVIDEQTGLHKIDEKTGKYLIGEKESYQGEDLWGHGDIILLVNGECISAGDHFTNMMYGQDNVKIMGFTKSNGSGQAVSGILLNSGVISFSQIPVLDENGDIYIDPGVNRKAGVHIDELVGIDEEALHVLFEEKGDYLLQKACEQ
ncbi:MAG: S41 family peptidase [Eubacteriales bacterium]|nr:S41 family peptidase [Eubacteriales bacterium]